MKRVIVLISTVALLAAAFHAWAGGTSEKPMSSSAVTLHCFVHYSEDQEKASFNYALDALKKQYPNVTIAIDVMPNDNDEKIKTLAATGDLPDLIDINASLVSLFSRSHKILVLDPYIDSSITSAFLPNANPMFKDKDGHILSVSNSVRHMGMLYYSRKIFADNGVKVPTRYSEFLDAVKAFHANGITPLALFAAQQWPAFTFYDMLVTAEEPGGFKKIETGTVHVSDKAFVDAARKFKELVDAGLVSKDAFTTMYDAAIASFFAGQAAMFQNGTWDVKNIGDKLGSDAGLLYPTVLSDNGGGWNSVGGGFGNGFSASADSKNKDIAGKLCGFLAVKTIEGQIVKNANINTMLAGTITPEIPYNALQQQLANDMKNFNVGTSFWWGLTNTKIQTAIGENLAKLLTGQYAVNDFISQTDQACRDALSGT